MPQNTERRLLLKELYDFIEENVGLLNVRAFRRSFISLLTLTASIEEVRYLERAFCGPTFYVARSDNILEEVVLPMSFREHKRCFRMEEAEFQRLVLLIDSDPVFHRREGPGRAQRHPALQLAVFLYQLGHAAPVGETGARFGRLPEGTVKNYSLRAATAIERLVNDVVAWPTVEERCQIKTRVRDKHNVPELVGFIDGTHIILHKEPSLHKDQAATFFCRKKRYAVVVLAICDDEKRFTYLQTGHFGSASDARAQSHVTLLSNPESHFTADEYILGDSGFVDGPRLVSMYRDWRGSRMKKFQSFFNAQVAPARVAIEHTFGILKMRWRALRDLNMRVGSREDLNVLLAWVRCAFVLHNLFIDTSRAYWDTEDYQESQRIQREIDAEIAEIEGHELYSDPSSFATRRDRLAYQIHVLEHPEKHRRRQRLFRNVL